MDREEKAKNVYMFEDTLAQYFSNKFIQTAATFSQENTKYYFFDSTQTFKAPLSSKKSNVYITENDTLTAAMMFSSHKTAILDFASAVRPGGGVMMGARGQEEDLCRCTTLYFTLNTDMLKKLYYKKEIVDEQLMMRSDCVYVPQIYVLKHKKDAFQRASEKQMKTVDVIVCSAPNLRCKAVDVSPDLLKGYHEERAHTIIRSAIDNGVHNLILGAFGCGAFHNPPEIVASAYENVIPQYQNYFDNIVFAVKKDGEKDLNYSPFLRMVLKLGGTVI